MENHRLSASESAKLAEDGYVIRERVFNSDEVAAVITECEAMVDRVVAARTGSRRHVGSYTFEREADLRTTIKWEGDSDVVHGLEPLLHLSDSIEHFALDARFVHPMIELVGDEEPALFTEKLNLKRPRRGGFNPLHQDMPYWSFTNDPTRIATAMLFLDDADRGNGTLEVVPRSHRDGLWQQRTDSDAFGSLEIDPNLETGADIVPVEVPAGSVVYFGSTLVHRSGPNTSDRERRSLLFSYAPPDQPHMSETLWKR